MSGFIDIPASNSITWSPGVITQTTWFKRLSRVNCMTDWTGSAFSNVVEMTVNPILPVSLSVSAFANLLCAGAQVTYTAIPVNPGLSPVYQWRVNGINAGANNLSYTYTPLNGDVVTCILTSSETCATNNPAASNLLTMTVKPVPVVSFTLCNDSITTTGAKPFRLKGGIPLGGTYSGPGVNPVSGIWNPASAGVGPNTITYSYTNVALCSATAHVRIFNFPFSIFTCGNLLEPAICNLRRSWFRRESTAFNRFFRI